MTLQNHIMNYIIIKKNILFKYQNKKKKNNKKNNKKQLQLHFNNK